MIDWQKATANDFDIQVEGEAIQESGDHIVFPVRVYHRNGTAAFLQSVPIASQFYRALKETPAWQDALLKIIRQRVRDELVRRLKKDTVSVEEKIEFIHFDKLPI